MASRKTSSSNDEMKKADYLTAINKFKTSDNIDTCWQHSGLHSRRLPGRAAKVISTILGANLYLYAAAFVLVFAACW